MSSKTNRPIVLSVGGSLVVPQDEIDTVFLEDLKKMIKKFAAKGRRFIIVVGGGSTARCYQSAAKKLGELTRDDLDWLGIHATRLNGHLLRTIFRDLAHPAMIKDPTKQKIKWSEAVLVAAGWKPGWSTDYVAVRLAKRFGAKVLLNLSNIDYVFDKDPNKFSDAQKIKNISWKNFRKIVGNEWDPGMNAPFDPVASRLAERINLKVVVLNGKKIKNTESLLSGKSFIGTVIEG